MELLSIKKILITGANGQLGSEIKEIADNYQFFNFIFTDVDELDISDKNAIKTIVETNKIDIIINCAAYTAVDKAENEPGLADKINHDAVRNLAEVSKEYDLYLIHISTDYVFDGKNYKPYIETDAVCPVGAYAQSKLKGENVIHEVAPKASIIRTSWLYSSFGSNFVKTMLRLGRDRDELNVVFDQVGSPTYAADLAKAALYVAQKAQNTNVEIYHFSNEGVCSWYDLAKAVLDIRQIKCNINPIETKDYPTPAQRPFYSVFNKTKIKTDFNIEIPHWHDALKRCLDII